MTLKHFFSHSARAITSVEVLKPARKRLTVILTVLLAFSAATTASQAEPKKKWQPASGIPVGLGYGFPAFDMYSGAHATHTIWAGYNHYIDQAELSDGLRAGALFLIDVPLLVSLTTFQHEYFGHLYRTREYGIGGSIEINPPFPYSMIDPEPKPAGLAIPDGIPPHNDGLLLVISGGLESELVAADLTREKYLLAGKLHKLKSYYTVNRFGTLYYILLHSGSSNPVAGGFTGDPEAYRLTLDAKYKQKDSLPVSSIRLHSLFLLLDPLTWRGIPYVGPYLYDGKMYKYNDVRFLPSSDYFLTPYGDEFQVHVYFKNKNKTPLYQATLRLGNGVDRFFYGATLKARRVFQKKRFFMGGTLGIWNQPEFNNGLAELNMMPGFVAAAQFELFYNKTLSGEIELGYKTTGYVPGRPLESGVFGWFGLNYILQQQK